MAVVFQFDFNSTLAAITYLASKDVPELTKYKLCKLLFLADKYHLVKFGRVITGDKYCALPNGPVPSHTLNLLNAVISEETLDADSTALAAALVLDRQYENPRFKAERIVDPTRLSQSDVLALEKIIAEYGRMGFGELKAITHEMYAYQKSWNNRTVGVKAADMSFEDFFEEDSDAVVGAREAMIEDDLLRKAFPEH